MKPVAALLVTTLWILPFAAKAQEETWESPLTQGHMELGGNFSFFNTSNANEKVSYLTTNARLQYFVMDRLSVGASGYFTSLSGGPLNRRFGLDATYYFYEKDRLALYVAQGFSYGSSYGEDNSMRGTTGIGTKYFLTKNVALDFSLVHDYGVGGNSQDWTSTGFTGGLSFYF